MIDIIENVFGKDLDAKDTSQNKGWGLLGPGGAAGPFGKRVRKKNKPRFVQTTQAKKRGPRDVTVRDGIVTCVMSGVHLIQVRRVISIVNGWDLDR